MFCYDLITVAIQTACVVKTNPIPIITNIWQTQLAPKHLKSVKYH